MDVHEKMLAQHKHASLLLLSFGITAKSYLLKDYFLLDKDLKYRNNTQHT